MRRAPGDNVLPDQFQTVPAVLASDWCQKTCWAGTTQHAKKGGSDSLRLEDFASRLVNSVLDLPNRQVIRGSLGNSNYRRTVISQNPDHQKIFSGLVKMTFELVHASYSLPKWKVWNQLSLHAATIWPRSDSCKALFTLCHFIQKLCIEKWFCNLCVPDA